VTLGGPSHNAHVDKAVQAKGSTVRAPVGKRVLMLVENNSYPEDFRVRQEATALTEAGYEVAVISPARPGQRWRETIDGVHVYRYPAPPQRTGVIGYLVEYGYSTAALFILSVLVYVRGGFDVVHVANPPDTLVFVAAPHKMLGKRFVYDHHDLVPELFCEIFPNRRNGLIHRALLMLEKISLRFADHIIATNHSYKAIEMERGGVSEERITIVRNGPVLNGWKRPEPDPGLRQKGRIIIGYVGIMGFQDGVDYLLRALHHLVYDLGRTHVFCVLIGGLGNAQPSLKRLATQLGLNDYVWFTGWVTDADLLRYLASVDICVDPDPSNPFNDRSTMSKMMEYMAQAKPIVAFDLPEHRFTAQAAAIYVRPNDELEFAQALVQLMDDPARRETMGAFGHRRVNSELAWRYSAQNLVGVYRRLFPVTGGENGSE
jgi:glycosyltransferase involved in cell wall biosynthesis